MKAYKPRLNRFLCILEAQEKRMAELAGVSMPDNDGPMSTEPLYQGMRISWERRDWMVNYTVRDTQVFDLSGENHLTSDTLGQTRTRTTARGYIYSRSCRRRRLVRWPQSRPMSVRIGGSLNGRRVRPLLVFTHSWLASGNKDVSYTARARTLNCPMFTIPRYRRKHIFPNYPSTPLQIQSA